jgi:hypothetical protein
MVVDRIKNLAVLRESFRCAARGIGSSRADGKTSRTCVKKRDAINHNEPHGVHNLD